jgi:hypothetical protein
MAFDIYAYVIESAYPLDFEYKDVGRGKKKWQDVKYIPDPTEDDPKRVIKIIFQPDEDILQMFAVTETKRQWWCYTTEVKDEADDRFYIVGVWLYAPVD